MYIPPFKTLIIIASIVFACRRRTFHVAADENVLVSLCSNAVNGPYSSLAMTDTATLVNSVPANQYNYRITQSYNVNGQVLPFWGHGACNGVVNAKYCHDCLVQALYNLNNCIGYIGGQVKLENCRLRYEVYQFDWNW